MSDEEKPERLVCLLHGCLKRTCVLCEKDAEIASLRSRLSAGGGKTIEELREEAAALSGALQLASRENEQKRAQIAWLKSRLGLVERQEQVTTWWLSGWQRKWRMGNWVEGDGRITRKIALRVARADLLYQRAHGFGRFAGKGDGDLDVADCAVTVEECRGVIRRMERRIEELRGALGGLVGGVDEADLERMVWKVKKGEAVWVCGPKALAAVEALRREGTRHV